MRALGHVGGEKCPAQPVEPGEQCLELAGREQSAFMQRHEDPSGARPPAGRWYTLPLERREIPA